MISRRVVLSLACIVFLFSAQIVAAQPVPRAAPPNDNFVNAQPITLGQTYTAKNIDQATIEAGQPGVTSCGVAGVVNHSVWYDFVSPQSGLLVHFSTQGTLLLGGDFMNYDTVLAAFAGNSIASLVQVACNDDSAGYFSTVEFTALPNTHYYILVGTYSATQYEVGSRLKLVTRVLSRYMYPVNLDFEQPLSSADWKVTNPTGDAVVCSNPTYPAALGLCAFRFQGNAGENSKITQTIPWPPFVPRKNGMVLAALYFRVMDTPSLGSAKFDFTVTYSDGTPPSKQTINMTGRAAGSYLYGQRLIYLASGKVASMKICVTFKSTSGTLMLDYIYMLYAATVPTRDMSVLPLPPAPAG